MGEKISGTPTNENGNPVDDLHKRSGEGCLICSKYLPQQTKKTFLVVSYVFFLPNSAQSTSASPDTSEMIRLHKRRPIRLDRSR